MKYAKATGIVRKVDHLGRIVLPKELRNSFKIGDKDPIEIFIEDDEIIIQKYEPNRACAVTGSISDENREFPGGLVLSPEGIELLKAQFEDTNSDKPMVKQISTVTEFHPPNNPDMSLDLGNMQFPYQEIRSKLPELLPIEKIEHSTEYKFPESYFQTAFYFKKKTVYVSGIPQKNINGDGARALNSLLQEELGISEYEAGTISNEENLGVVRISYYRT